jgi:flagella basal body P-ring formation protein FlgA
MRPAALGLLLGLTAALQAAQPQAVALRVSATAHGPNIVLGDLLDGLPPEAHGISVKASGMPGSSVSVDAPLVALKLRRAPGGPYQLGGAQQSHVSVGRLDLPGETLRRFAHEHLLARLSGVAGAEISPLGAVADLKLYDAPVTLQAAPLEDGQLRGNLVMRVQVLQEGPGGQSREAASVPVSFLIKRSEQRLVATQIIRKGEDLGPHNLALREQDATYEDRGFGSLDEVEGKRARAYIGAGKALTRSLVELPPLVRRGDTVRVMVQSGGVLIEATGKALRDAREGDSLPVQMDGTKKQIQARCVAAGVVVHGAR